MSDSFQPSLSLVETFQQERDLALEEATRWRRRYEREAQQRRTEAEVAEQTIRDLRTELIQLCQSGTAVRQRLRPAPQEGQDALERLTSAVDQLAQERDALAAALAQEQQQHSKTRENLISALGEALQRSKS